MQYSAGKPWATWHVPPITRQHAAARHRRTPPGCVRTLMSQSQIWSTVGIHGLELFWHIQLMLDLIGTDIIWRPDWCLELFVMFLCPFPRSLCSTAGRLVPVKWHPREYQIPTYPSRTLYKNKMINVIHFTCQFFKCWGWSAYVILCLPEWGCCK